LPTPSQTVGHYENFPVASLLLPARLRRPVAAIYRFARTADDFADEGDLPPAQRLALLDGYREELHRLQTGEPTQNPLFTELGEVMLAWELPIAPFFDLLDAFSQDVTQARYASFADVLDYSRRSADPVGRLMLQLYGALEDERRGQRLAWSDAICSALQLINFWQDVAIDFRKDRIYLPQDEMARFSVDEAQIGRGDTGGGWRALMTFQVSRARQMLLSGAPLATQLGGRIGLELRMIVQGGARILDKIDAVQGDVFRHRPVLGGADWPLMLWRAAWMRQA
jgi:squalene synthase HpnC